MSNPGKFAGRGNPHRENDNESESTVPGQGVPSLLGGIPPGHYRKNDNESEFTVPGKGVPSLLGGVPPGHYRAGDISEGGVPGLFGGVPPGALLGAVWTQPIETTVEDELYLTALVFFDLVKKEADFKGSGSVILEDQVYDTDVKFNPDDDAVDWDDELNLVIRGDSDVSAGNWHVLTGDEKTTHENVQEDGGAVTMSSEGKITLHGDYNENNDNEDNDNDNEMNDETNDNEMNDETNDNQNNDNELNDGIDNTWASAFFDTTDEVVDEFNYFFNFEDGTFNSEINNDKNSENNNNEANDENNDENNSENNSENNNNENNNNGNNDGNNDIENNDGTSFSEIFGKSYFSMTDDAEDYFEAILLNNGYYIMTNSTEKDTFGVDGAEYVLVEHGTANTYSGISWEDVLYELGADDSEEIDVIGVGYTGFWDIGES